MNQQFDPTAFLDMPMDEALVKRPPIAAGDYVAQIKDITSEMWQSKDKVDPTTGALRSGMKFNVTLSVNVSQEEATRVGLREPVLEMKDTVMIDLDNGKIATGPGKNPALRRYRDAVDMNKPGVPFQPRAMIGQLLKVKISHREYPVGSGDFFEQIDGVARV